MTEPELAMLWENASPTQVLMTRFGFASPTEIARFVTTLLADRWGRQISVTRVALSDQNAIVWVADERTAESFVVKLSIDVARFDRLAAISRLLAPLEAAGIASVAPVLTTAGEARVRARHQDLEYSIIVQPHCVGTLLSDGDESQAFAAGRALGDLHLALAAIPAVPAALVDPIPDPIERLRAALASSVPVPRAKTFIRTFVDRLSHTERFPDFLTHLIHDDFRGANVILSGIEVRGILDFDEMRLGHRVVDLARSLTVLSTEFRRWEPAPPELSDAFLRGYREIVALTPDEMTWLPILHLVAGIGQAPGDGRESSWSHAIERQARVRAERQ